MALVRIPAEAEVENFRVNIRMVDFYSHPPGNVGDHQYTEDSRIQSVRLFSKYRFTKNSSENLDSQKIAEQNISPIDSSSVGSIPFSFRTPLI